MAPVIAPNSDVTMYWHTVHFHITGAKYELKPLEVNKNKIFLNSEFKLWGWVSFLVFFQIQIQKQMENSKQIIAIIYMQKFVPQLCSFNIFLSVHYEWSIL